MTAPVTIYTQEPGKYHVWKTIGGYVVVFIEDRHNYRNVDGGKVHAKRQNAYAKAKRLNHPVKHALKRHGMAECYFDGNTAIVREDENGETYETEYVLTIQEGAMPPYFTKTAGTIEEIETEIKNSKFGGRAWKAVKPEEI